MSKKGFEGFSMEWLAKNRPLDAAEVFKVRKSTLKGRSCNLDEPMKPECVNSSINHACKINIKPLSVNRAWMGRRFKSKEYKAYEAALLLLLPNFILPASPLKIFYEFGFSAKGADLDNPVKSLQDCLSKKYHFNDYEVFELHVKKVIVNKGEEYLLFKIESLE